MNHYNKGHRDTNEAGIREVLDARGIRYTQLREGDGADLLIWIQPMELWEVKNPAQSPCKQQLTDDERAAKEYCEINGINYVVMKTQDQAIERLNEHISTGYLRS